MITKINKLKNFGIFQNYIHDNSLADFKQYNLFYGWNGSGKSTLVDLFRWIETKQPINFLDSEWEVTSEANIINQSNVTSNVLNIKVFNKDFVEKNVFTENGVKGIVYLSEKVGTDKAKLVAEELILKEQEKVLKKVDIELNGDKADKKSKGLCSLNDSFLTNAAKSIKANFKVIEIEDSRLLNYDKTKLSNFIENNKDKIQTNISKLSVSEIEKLSKSIKPQDKSFIDLASINKFNTTLFDSIYKRVIELQLTVITAKTIERLKKEVSIAKWVYEGLKEIHTPDSIICEFCGQKLPADRILELNKHFSDEFENLKIALAKGIDWIDETPINIDFPHYSQLYEEFQKEYEVALAEHKIIVNGLNAVLSEWRNMLEKKQNNPFEIPDNTITEISIDVITEYEKAYDKIIKCIKEHNKKFDGLDKKVAEDKQKLELHYVSEEVTTYDFIAKKIKEDLLLKQYKSANEEIEKLKGSIDTLKKALSDELLGENEFNLMLHKFLGRNDISLETRLEGGYLIKRGDKTIAKNLSEGEKTAIGLVYFMAKIKEEGNKVEETIVVIDDPISSFDSNHLFHANFYLKHECENAKQLFVFTHNFRFFSMQKEWIATKKIKDSTTNKNVDSFNLYLIKPEIITDVRQGKLENADSILTHFDSEYHMLFSEVKKFVQNPKVDYISSHTISNTCRQLLESFLSFKYGRKKLEKCFDEITDFDELSKVRKFVNHYSHKVDNGESIKGFNDNIFGEADKIVPLVLLLIEHVDNVHYKSMMDRLSNS